MHVAAPRCTWLHNCRRSSVDPSNVASAAVVAVVGVLLCACVRVRVRVRRRVPTVPFLISVKAEFDGFITDESRRVLVDPQNIDKVVNHTLYHIDKGSKSVNQ